MQIPANHEVLTALAQVERSREQRSAPDMPSPPQPPEVLADRLE